MNVHKLSPSVNQPTALRGQKGPDKLSEVRKVAGSATYEQFALYMFCCVYICTAEITRRSTFLLYSAMETKFDVYLVCLSQWKAFPACTFPHSSCNTCCCLCCFGWKSNLTLSVKYGATEDKEWADVKFKCFMSAFSLVTVRSSLWNLSQSWRRDLHNKEMGAGLSDWSIFRPIGEHNL